MSDTTRHKHTIQIGHDELVNVIDIIGQRLDNLDDTMKAYGDGDELWAESKEEIEKLRPIIKKLETKAGSWCYECRSSKCVCDVQIEERKQ